MLQMDFLTPISVFRFINMGVKQGLLFVIKIKSSKATEVFWITSSAFGTSHS